MPEHNISFISLKNRITDLLLKALMIDSDSANTQMLLGKFSCVCERHYCSTSLMMYAEL